MSFGTSDDAFSSYDFSRNKYSNSHSLTSAAKTNFQPSNKISLTSSFLGNSLGTVPNLSRRDINIGFFRIVLVPLNLYCHYISILFYSATSDGSIRAQHSLFCLHQTSSSKSRDNSLTLSVFFSNILDKLFFCFFLSANVVRYFDIRFHFSADVTSVFKNRVMTRDKPRTHCFADFPNLRVT